LEEKIAHQGRSCVKKKSAPKISAATVREDFNELRTVIHYTRAAHELGLWESERLLIQRYFPDRNAPLLEAGCGAGRVTVGLWSLGYRRLTAFDFARELVDQAISLAMERNAQAIRFLVADATKLSAVRPKLGDFAGAFFMFNGLMQIPGRQHRRVALRGLRALCTPGAPLLFTTHDRDHSPTERAMWRLETLRWVRGDQDPQLVEFGDRYFEDETGRTFMHLPDRREILEDLTATGWRHEFDALRSDIAREPKAVREFSDECRFWLCRRSDSQVTLSNDVV
jgi:SAM-dependent methyltransferase